VILFLLNSFSPVQYCVNIFLSGGSLASASDIPSPESVVNWLIEHVETLPAEDSDSDSVSSVDYDSDTDSTSDVFEDLDSSGEVCQLFPVLIFLFELSLAYLYPQKRSLGGYIGVTRWSVGRSSGLLHFPCPEHNLKTNSWNSI
jgi:hypothetical protein